jgi:hypothetical protein
MMVDIFMPHMRGFESIRIFHERAPTVPLIAMSGYAFANLNSPAPDFLRMALELGATRCLRKPFTPAALLTVINECMGKRSPLRERGSVEIAAPACRSGPATPGSTECLETPCRPRSRKCKLVEPDGWRSRSVDRRRRPRLRVAENDSRSVCRPTS